MTVTSLDYAEKRYTSQDGLSLYYRDYGPSADGLTPVLCLPGLTRNSCDFSAISKRLMRERRVICPDFRGRGLSDHDPNWQNYEPTTYIGDIRHLLCALNIHRVFVIGTSMGGLLTMGMGAAMPTVLAGALINDVGPDIGESGVEKIIAYMRDGAAGFADWPDAVAFLRARFPEIPANTDEEWLWIAKGTFQKSENGRIEHNWDRAIIKPLLAPSAELDLWPMFKSLRGRPLVVTHGALSDILSAETLAKMQGAIPELTAVTVQGIGHMPSLSEPECQEALNNALAIADHAQHRRYPRGRCAH